MLVYSGRQLTKWLIIRLRRSVAYAYRISMHRMNIPVNLRVKQALLTKSSLNVPEAYLVRAVGESSFQVFSLTFVFLSLSSLISLCFNFGTL
jgi:hypothetical protein